MTLIQLDHSTEDFSFQVYDETSGTTYTPWTRDGAVGFQVERRGEHIGYIFLNPSESDDEEGAAPNVFVYQERVPAFVGAVHHYLCNPEDFS